MTPRSARRPTATPDAANPVVHRLISVVMLFRRAGGRYCAGRGCSGMRPVVWSAGSGSATRIPAISRPSAASARSGPGQLLGGRRACRDPQHGRGRAHHVSHLRSLGIDDRDYDGQRSSWRPVDVAAARDGNCQMARSLRWRGRWHGACGSQHGCGVRVLLRADNEGRGNPQGCGEDRQLGADGEGSRIGGKRQDGERGTAPSLRLSTLKSAIPSWRRALRRRHASKSPGL